MPEPKCKTVEKRSADSEKCAWFNVSTKKTKGTTDWLCWFTGPGAPYTGSTKYSDPPCGYIPSFQI